MAGIGNISQIEMSYMNSMITFARAYQNNSKLIEIRPLLGLEPSGERVFIPKSKIVSITREKFDGENCYHIKTEYDIFRIDVKQGDKLIKEW